MAVQGMKLSSSLMKCPLIGKKPFTNAAAWKTTEGDTRCAGGTHEQKK